MSKVIDNLAVVDDFKRGELDAMHGQHPDRLGSERYFDGFCYGMELKCEDIRTKVLQRRAELEGWI